MLPALKYSLVLLIAVPHPPHIHWPAPPERWLAQTAPGECLPRSSTCVRTAAGTQPGRSLLTLISAPCMTASVYAVAVVPVHPVHQLMSILVETTPYLLFVSVSCNPGFLLRCSVGACLLAWMPYTSQQPILQTQVTHPAKGNTTLNRSEQALRWGIHAVRWE